MHRTVPRRVPQTYGVRKGGVSTRAGRAATLMLLGVFVLGGYSTAAAYTVNVHVQCAEAGWAPLGAVLEVLDVDPVPGGSYTVEALPLSPLAAAVVNASGDCTATFTWPSAGGGYEVGGPDLIFRLTQNVGGAVETIYEETVAETHWNVPSADASDPPPDPVSLQITSPLAVCWNPAIDPADPEADRPLGRVFMFTRIGSYAVDDVDCADVAGSTGYCRPRKAPFNFPKTGEDGSYTDMPFGSIVELYAWFGEDCDIDYYSVECSTDGGATWPHKVKTPLPNKRLETPDPYDPLTWHWVPVSMGPFTVDGNENLYTIPYLLEGGGDQPWTYIDRVARLDTRLMPAGLCKVKIRGYKWSGDPETSSLVEATVSDDPLDAAADIIVVPASHGRLVLQIDNTPPVVQILNLRLGTTPMPPCGILDFSDSTAEINVDFRVRDERGHLRMYNLAAMYGHNQVVTPEPTQANLTDNYGNHGPGPVGWHGELSYTTTYQASEYPDDQMPTCAYQFRLSASKRTTNGYGLIYRDVEDTWHVTIQRTSTP